MTQLSVAPTSASAGPAAAQAPGEAAPQVLAQAGDRAEFAARLFEAFAALRGLGASAAAPATIPTPVEDAALASEAAAPAPVEEPSENAATEESAETEATLGIGAPATPEVPASFVPLILPELTSRAPAAPAEVGPSEPEPSSDRTAEATPLRLARFAPAEAPAPARSGDAQAAEPTPEAAIEGAPTPVEPARAGRESEERARKGSPEPRADAAEPLTDPAFARASDVAVPAAQGARSDSASSAPGRVLPELPVRNEQEIIDQVRFLLNRKGGEARIELHPPQLGQLGLKISVTEHGVRLEITADRLPVADLLSRHLPELQRALEAQGLQIDRAQVDLRERASDGRERGTDSGEPDARRGRNADDSPSDPGYTRSTLPAYSLGAVDVHA